MTNLEALQKIIRMYFHKDPYLTRFLSARYYFFSPELNDKSSLLNYDASRFQIPGGAAIIEDQYSLLGYADKDPGQIGLLPPRLYIHFKKGIGYVFAFGIISNIKPSVTGEFSAGHKLMRTMHFNLDFSPGKEMIDPPKIIEDTCGMDAVHGLKQLMEYFARLQ